MKTLITRNLLAAAVVSVAAAMPAVAQEAGDWQFRVGLGYIAPDTSNDDLVFSGMPLDTALLSELTSDRDATPKEAALEKAEGLKPDLRGPVARAHDEMKRIEHGDEKNQDEGSA